MRIENSNEAISNPMMRRTRLIAEMINPGRWTDCGGVFWTEVAIVHSIAHCRVELGTTSSGSLSVESKPRSG
ncbi:hypothetical protein D3C75_644840 [compost metagenome]